MTNQPNIEKSRQERWESWLDTIFARRPKIKEIRMSKDLLEDVAEYLRVGGYPDDKLIPKDETEIPMFYTIFDILVVIDDTCLTSPKIVYKDGILSPDPYTAPDAITDDDWYDPWGDEV